MINPLDAYRTCEFATLSKDGTPVAWPTSALIRADGTILLTTSLAYPMKAFNVRRDPRVALLFSDPTGSGLSEPEQILVTGVASCPDAVHVDPVGDLADFWRMIFRRQPKSGAYLDWPANRLTDFYFMRLLITIDVTSQVSRPLPGARNAVTSPTVLADYPTVVLAAPAPDGSPQLVRTTVTEVDGGYRVDVPDDVRITEGPAGLLVHRHDDQLWNMHNAGIRGTLSADRIFRPQRTTEPGGRPGLANQLRVARECRAATERYLEKRSLSRPVVPWSAYRTLRAEARRPVAAPASGFLS